MRATVIRRTAAVAAVASLALLATACGGAASGDDAKSNDKAEAKAESATTAPAAKALTAAELKKAVLAQGDLKNHTVEKPGAGDVAETEDVSVDKAACEPIAYLMNNAPVGEPAAKIHRIVNEEPHKPTAEELAEMSDEEQLTAGMNLTITATSLYAYDGKGAEEALTAVRTATEKCADGFSGTASGEDATITKITEESVSGGDEAAAWTVTTKHDGDVLPFKLVVVRRGSTLASFVSLNPGASLSGKKYDLPTALIKAQLDKLG